MARINEFGPGGGNISPLTGYSGGGLDDSRGIAIDSSGNVWVANDFFPYNLSEFNSGGTAVSGTGGYSGGGLNKPNGIVVDGSGHVWAANYFNPGSISKFASDGTAISGTGGYTGGGLNQPKAIAVDGSGDVWVANTGSLSLTEFIGAATPVVTPISAGLPLVATTDGTSSLGTRP